jgi:hypothetical protein
MKKPIFAPLFLILALVSLPVGAQAQVIDLDSGPGFTGAGPGNGRALGIQTTENVDVTALGIFGELSSQSYDVLIYSSTDGHQAVSILAEASGMSGGTGLGWNDLPVNYTLQSGQYYVLHWRPSSSNNSWTSNLQYLNDSNLPFTVGPILMIDGADGFDTGDLRFSNSLHPHLRIGGEVTAVPVLPPVPVPTLGQWGLIILALSVLGFGAVVIARRKRRLPI